MCSGRCRLTFVAEKDFFSLITTNQIMSKKPIQLVSMIHWSDSDGIFTRMASAVVDAVFGSYDIKNAKQWRDEDLKHREQEKQWREDAIQREIAWRNDDLEREYRIFKLENEKRIIDARHSQLTSIAQLGALLSAFTMITMVEVSLPPDLNQFLLVIYAGAGVIVVRVIWVSEVHRINGIHVVSLYVDEHADLHTFAFGNHTLCYAYSWNWSARLTSLPARNSVSLLYMVVTAMWEWVGYGVPLFLCRYVISDLSDRKYSHKFDRNLFVSNIDSTTSVGTVSTCYRYLHRSYMYLWAGFAVLETTNHKQMAISSPIVTWVCSWFSFADRYIFDLYQHLDLCVSSILIHFDRNI